MKVDVGAQVVLSILVGWSFDCGYDALVSEYFAHLVVVEFFWILDIQFSAAQTLVWLFKDKSSVDPP